MLFPLLPRSCSRSESRNGIGALCAEGVASGGTFRRRSASTLILGNDFALDDISLELLSAVAAGEHDKDAGSVPDSPSSLYAALPALVLGLHRIRSRRHSKQAA